MMNKDDLIVKAFLDAELDISGDSLDELDKEYTFSDDFEESMQKLISKNERIRLDTRRRISRSLIAAIIAIIVMFTGLLSVSASKYNPLDFITSSQKKDKPSKSDKELFKLDFPSISNSKHKDKNYSMTSTTNKKTTKKKPSAKQLAISINVGENGTVSTSNVKVKYGEDAPSILISANQNYVISSLTIDGVEVSKAIGKESYDVSRDLKSVKANHTINAEFALDKMEVTFNISGTGMVDIRDGESISNAGLVKVINDSNEASLTDTRELLAGQTIQAAVSQNKYHIESFMVGSDELIDSFDNDTHESPLYTFDKTSTSITVIFALDAYSISINEPENGTASLDTNEVRYGDQAIVTLKPDEEYEISLFEINGEDMLDYITDDNTFVIENITDDVSIEVQYSAISL